jgi:hypothetical protein
MWEKHGGNFTANGQTHVKRSLQLVADLLLLLSLLLLLLLLGKTPLG